MFEMNWQKSVVKVRANMHYSAHVTVHLVWYELLMLKNVM